MINSPLHNFGSMAFFCLPGPNATTGIPPSTTVDMNGPGKQARPISSSNITRSRKLNPPPPYCSGNGSPTHPNSAISFHNSTTYPLSSSSICLTNVFGTLLAKKSRADFHNISCSSVNDRSIFVSFPSNFLLGCRLWLSGQSQGTGCGISGYLSGSSSDCIADRAQIDVLHPPSEPGPLVFWIHLPPVAPDGAQLAVESHDLHAHLSHALSGNTAKYLDVVGCANHIPTGKR